MVFDWLRRLTLPRAQVLVQDGFVDIDLPLHSYRRSDAGIVEITARGRLQGRSVGIGFRLGSEWKPHDLEDVPVTLFWGDGEILNVGPESRRFVASLCKLYGQQPTNGEMPECVPVSVVGLNNDPRVLPDHPVKMKLFIEPDNDDLYGEVYLNVDVDRGIVEFHEKDPEYRKNVLQALGQST